MSQEIQPKISKAMNAGMTKGGTIKGFVPETFEDIQRCATLAVNAGHFNVMRKDDRGFDTKEINEAKSIANATLAIMQGMEAGMPVVMAIQLIAVINGRCVIYGEAIPALIWRAGHDISEWIDGEGDSAVAYCEIKRSDVGITIKRSFSVADAKQANLWDTSKTNSYGKPNKSPWHCYPLRMLQMRARGFCARDAVPDVLNGIYVREEMEDAGVDLLTAREYEQPNQVSQKTTEIEMPDFGTVPAAIEDRSAQNKAEEATPSVPTLREVPEMMTPMAQRERVSEEQLAKSAEFIADAAKAVEEKEKRPRGRPRKSAPRTEEKEEATPEEIVLHFATRFDAATSPDELNQAYDDASEAAKAFSSELRGELDAAYNAKYDVFEQEAEAA